MNSQSLKILLNLLTNLIINYNLNFMKKVFFVGMVFGALALTSCKKEYTCEYSDGTKVSYSEDDYSDEQIKDRKAACLLTDGTWSE